MKHPLLACDHRLLDIQPGLLRSRSLESRVPSTLLRFAVHVCMWSIVAIRAFNDPDLCDWSTVKGFPPPQEPSLADTVLHHLVNVQPTTHGVDILWCGDMATITTEQQEQFIDRIYDVVKHLADPGSK